MSATAKNVQEQAATAITANEVAATLPTVTAPPVKTAATTADILNFVISQTEKPTLSTSAIDTSNVDLRSYRVEDVDINSVYNDCGWTNIKLVDEEGQVVPNARVQITHKSGNTYLIPPLFFAVLLARKSTIELTLEKQLKAFSEQGSMKARGTSFKFIMSQEQLDAAQAKAELQYELDTKTMAEKFQTWINGYAAPVNILPVLWTAFKAGASLVALAADKVFIRQTIPATSEQVPFELPELELVTTTPDQIGDVLISTCYTYQLAV